MTIIELNVAWYHGTAEFTRAAVKHVLTPGRWRRPRTDGPERVREPSLKSTA